MAIQEKASWELNDLQLRMQYLEGGDELADDGRAAARGAVAAAGGAVGRAGLSREAWAAVQDVIQRSIVRACAEGLPATNEFLVGQGVLRDIDLSSRVKRGVAACRRHEAGSAARPAGQADAA